MIIVENCQNGPILKWHRDDVKHLPRRVWSKINHNENNPMNHTCRNCHCNCDCKHLARQISNKYNDCSSPFSFQDRFNIPKWTKWSSTQHGMDHKLVRKPTDQRR